MTVQEVLALIEMADGSFKRDAVPYVYGEWCRQVDSGGTVYLDDAARGIAQKLGVSDNAALVSKVKHECYLASRQLQRARIRDIELTAESQGYACSAQLVLKEDKRYDVAIVGGKSMFGEASIQYVKNCRFRRTEPYLHGVLLPPRHTRSGYAQLRAVWVREVVS